MRKKIIIFKDFKEQIKSIPETDQSLERDTSK